MYNLIKVKNSKVQMVTSMCNGKLFLLQSFKNDLDLNLNITISGMKNK